MNAENEKVLGTHAWYNYHYGQHDPVPIGRFCKVLKMSKEKHANGQLEADGLVDFLIEELRKVPWESDDPEPSTKHGSTDIRVNQPGVVVRPSGRVVVTSADGRVEHFDSMVAYHTDMSL